MTRQRYLFGNARTCEETDVAFPDRQLANDEQVVKHLHPHWITLVLPVFACRRFPFAGPAAYWLLAAGDFGRRPAADPVRQGRGLCRTRARRAG